MESKTEGDAVCSVFLKNLPAWLKASHMFQVLASDTMGEMEDNDDTTLVLKTCFLKDTDSVISVQDLEHVLRIYDYWDLFAMPSSVYNYIHETQLTPLEWDQLKSNLQRPDIWEQLEVVAEFAKLGKLAVYKSQEKEQIAQKLFICLLKNTYIEAFQFVYLKHDFCHHKKYQLLSAEIGRAHV